MLGQAFQHLPAQIQAIVLTIGRLKPHQYVRSAMRVVVKAAAAASALHSAPARPNGQTAGGRCHAPGTAPRSGLRPALMRTRDHPADLRYLQAVSQPNPVMIAIGGDEHLGLVPRNRRNADGMDDAVAVALKIALRGPRAIDAIQRKLAPARLGVGLLAKAAKQSSQTTLRFLAGDARSLHRASRAGIVTSRRTCGSSMHSLHR